MQSCTKPFSVQYTNETPPNVQCNETKVLLILRTNVEQTVFGADHYDISQIWVLIKLTSLPVLTRVSSKTEATL